MAEHRPHLALLDLLLPGTDGIELMHEVHRIADVPVIFLSVYGHDETVARAFDMGAADYLVKPFSPTELTARIRAALRRGLEPSRTSLREPASWVTKHRLRPAAGDAGRGAGGSDQHGVRGALPVGVQAPRVLTHDLLLQRVWGPELGG